MTPAEKLRQLAAGQDGQFATAQAIQVGVTPNVQTGMRRRRETEQVRHGVSRFTSAPGQPDVAVTAALACWPNAVVSHASAARWHGLTRIDPPELPEITVPHGEVRKPSGIKVHWSRSLPDGDIIRSGNIGYTTVARTVIDLASSDDPWQSLALLDDAVAAGAKQSWIHHRARALANGRDGVALIREATHRNAASQFRSWLERAAAHVYRVGGLPDPEWNVRIRDGAGLIGIVDAYWRPWAVIAEKEGLRFHTSPQQRRADAQRFNRLLDADYRVRRFTWEDIVHDPVDVVIRLYRALNAAGARLDTARIPQKIELPARPFLL